MKMTISIGAILWDVFGPGPDNERIGGAPFNFAAHAAQLGHNVAFVSAVGTDARGERALARMSELGLDTRFVKRVSNAPTGHVTIDLSVTGQPDYVIHRPAAYDFASLSDADADADFDALAAMSPDWIYYGTLEQMSPKVRQLTKRLIATCPRAQRIYDPTLRKDSYSAALVRELLADATVLKLNEEEAGIVGAMVLGDTPASLEDFCRSATERLGCQTVCVTRGEHGCVILHRGQCTTSPGHRVTVVDTVGAGDAFAAALVHGLGAGWPLQQIADFANRRGAWVAGCAGAIPDSRDREAAKVAK
jgi:fructokinase